MFTKFRKETSERSDASNWAKKCLIQNTSFHFDSIEGCNENEQNVVTHLMERARVDYDGQENMSINEISNAIIQLESQSVLERKINFARAFNLNLSYVLYNDETQNVWLYEFEHINKLHFVNQFNSFVDFSSWIAQIKGWKSSKSFREIADLPLFDKVLRRSGTAWPTNIDCFVSDENNQPIAILEFQNAKATSVKEHCNNEYFLCKQEYTDPYSGNIKYHDDIRRWLSQEILRVQSGLRLFILTWAQNSDDFVLKEVESITFPELPYDQNWSLTNTYKSYLHRYSTNKEASIGHYIANTFMSFNLEYSKPFMFKIIHQPPLSAKDKSFPFIYYKFKWKILEQKSELPNVFNRLVAEQ